MGRENLVSGPKRLEDTPEIQAARWIRSHTDSNDVVVARQISLIYHYAKRKVVWFPPITDPKVLMSGIREHHAKYVIVVDRDYSYYLPPEADCFAVLNRAYPDAFRLVEKERQLRIYEVRPTDLPVNRTN
jgi:hypothetical protein